MNSFLFWLLQVFLLCHKSVLRHLKKSPLTFSQSKRFCCYQGLIKSGSLTMVASRCCLNVFLNSKLILNYLNVLLLSLNVLVKHIMCPSSSKIAHIAVLELREDKASKWPHPSEILWHLFFSRLSLRIFYDCCHGLGCPLHWFLHSTPEPSTDNKGATPYGVGLLGEYSRNYNKITVRITVERWLKPSQNSSMEVLSM